MKGLPQRRSLVVQTADYLREAIRRGEWRDYLPGLRSLSDRLQVSIYTLHLSLDVLEKEGLIRVAHGRRTGILRSVPENTEGETSSEAVAALTTANLEHMSESAHYTIARLTQSLQAAGLDLSIHADPRFAWQHPSRRLEQLVAANPAACWMLFSVNEAIQRWFMERNLKTLIAGSRFPGIRLPSVAQDYEGIGRDAARRLLELGHRRVAYLTVDNEREGDRAAERGFLDEFRGAPAATEPQLFHHNRSRSGLLHILDKIMRDRNPPTALFVSAPNYVLAVSQYLLYRGIVPGRDISILARDLLTILDFTVPRLAGYKSDRTYAARIMARRVITLARSGALPRRETLIPWRFVDGETLAPPPASRPRVDSVGAVAGDARDKPTVLNK